MTARFRPSIGTCFGAAGRFFMITSLEWKGDSLSIIRFMDAEISKSSVILGKMIYKKTTEDFYKSMDEGKLSYIGVRDLPRNYLDIIGFDS